MFDIWPHSEIYEWERERKLVEKKIAVNLLPLLAVEMTLDQC